MTNASYSAESPQLLGRHDRNHNPSHFRQNLGMRGIWKWIGMAGVAGVVAGGVLVARDQRKRNSYTPDDIRAKLHQRAAEAGATE